MKDEFDKALISKNEFDQLKTRLERVGQQKIVIVTGSMAPLLPVGADAMIEACDFEEIKRLDMIVFWSVDRLICHAVCDFGYLPAPNGERTVVTRGLANPGFDFPVSESDILGRVISHELSNWMYFRAIAGGALRRCLRLMPQERKY